MDYQKFDHMGTLRWLDTVIFTTLLPASEKLSRDLDKLAWQLAGKFKRI